MKIISLICVLLCAINSIAAENSAQLPISDDEVRENIANDGFTFFDARHPLFEPDELEKIAQFFSPLGKRLNDESYVFRDGSQAKKSDLYQLNKGSWVKINGSGDDTEMLLIERNLNLIPKELLEDNQIVLTDIRFIESHKYADFSNNTNVSREILYAHQDTFPSRRVDFLTFQVFESTVSSHNLVVSYAHDTKENTEVFSDVKGWACKYCFDHHEILCQSGCAYFINQMPRERNGEMVRTVHSRSGYKAEERRKRTVMIVQMTLVDLEAIGKMKAIGRWVEIGKQEDYIIQQIQKYLDAGKDTIPLQFMYSMLNKYPFVFYKYIADAKKNKIFDEAKERLKQIFYEKDLNDLVSDNSIKIKNGLLSGDRSYNVMDLIKLAFINRAESSNLIREHGGMMALHFTDVRHVIELAKAYGCASSELIRHHSDKIAILFTDAKHVIELAKAYRFACSELLTYKGETIASLFTAAQQINELSKVDPPLAKKIIKLKEQDITSLYTETKEIIELAKYCPVEVLKLLQETSISSLFRTEEEAFWLNDFKERK